MKQHLFIKLISCGLVCSCNYQHFYHYVMIKPQQLTVVHSITADRSSLFNRLVVLDISVFSSKVMAAVMRVMLSVRVYRPVKDFLFSLVRLHLKAMMLTKPTVVLNERHTFGC